MVEDAIGMFVLAVIAIILAILAGLSLLFSLDLLSAAVSWAGLGPGVGWTLLGGACGALIGMVQGMRARGKSDDLRKVYAGVAIVAVVLVAAGAASPAGRIMLGW